MSKSPDAFRTISEVAEWLGVQAHVLRFWESKFSQVKPVKRAGGRRYYRPNDMLLLGGIKQLLHDDGMTIKGVQKLLREKGTSEVAALSKPISVEDEAADEVESTVVQFRPQEEDVPAIEDPLEEAIAETTLQEKVDEKDTAEPAFDDPEPALFDLDEAPQDVVTEASYGLDADLAEEHAALETNAEEDTTAPDEQDDVAVLPSFLHRRDPAPAQTAEVAAPQKKPMLVDAPDPPAEQDIAVDVGILSYLGGLSRLNAQQAAEILPLMDDLRVVLERQSSARAG
ncbi:MAG: MerR family transcriptional regulator [Arenibacterium sp.]